MRWEGENISESHETKKPKDYTVTDYYIKKSKFRLR